MSTNFNYKQAVEELKTNPYFDKYSKKIAALQQTSPEDFLSRLETVDKSKKPPSPTKDLDSRPEVCQVGEPKPSSTSFTKTKVLDDVMKIELVEDKSPDEIKDLWLEYHKSKDTIAAVIPPEKFKIILERGEKYQLFLLPLPRKQGYEFIVCQFASNEVHFTPLISYQAHKENAPECLTIIYFPDLEETKGIVLMKGEFDKNVINAMEAQCLANQLHLYYGENNEKRTKLLERFTNDPQSFRHMDLIAEMENLTF
ncbi:ATP synthase mitochondrial F1 complex assembly factor 1 [Nilaparvata lugens]|uniref:ATP synthase mitochondrial F1 complex assembly factor 1 n=1 Tax=Nilaparvata lugens TaxID=108931 RepID=UPI00193D21BB|nr:ATP synthase mitochondrial F1 complex assembly factor 1 [Nilaparvata lugens]